MKAIISYNDPKSVISEQYRAIRTNIEYSNVDQNTKTILVTSSDKNEGKTTTVSNLAVSFANLNKKVLLIDCDLRNASIHKMFRLNNIYGLTDILAKDRAVDKCIQKTELENLYVLTAGSTPPNPAEILSSEKMKNLIEDLKNIIVACYGMSEFLLDDILNRLVEKGNCKIEKIIILDGSEKDIIFITSDGMERLTEKKKISAKKFCQIN